MNKEFYNKEKNATDLKMIKNNILLWIDELSRSTPSFSNRIELDRFLGIPENTINKLFQEKPEKKPSLLLITRLHANFHIPLETLLYTPPNFGYTDEIQKLIFSYLQLLISKTQSTEISWKESNTFLYNTYTNMTIGNRNITFGLSYRFSKLYIIDNASSNASQPFEISYCNFDIQQEFLRLCYIIISGPRNSYETQYSDLQSLLDEIKKGNQTC